MRVVIQRVKRASVAIDDNIVSEIKKGLLVFLAIHRDDDEEKIWKMLKKIKNLRVFDDQEGKINLDIQDVNGELLIVSQFTLYADTNKGNRPSFRESALPEKAQDLYTKFVQAVKNENLKKVVTGQFGTEMEVELINDGPVTIIIDI